MDEVTDHPWDDFGLAFQSAFGRLDATVRGACARHGEWPAKVRAAIYAALEFAVAEPTAARVLTVDALIERTEGAQRHVRLIEHFAAMLRAEAPRDARQPLSTEQALVGGVATIVADCLRSGESGLLLATGPELVQLVLLPYVGASEARRWACSSAGDKRVP